MILQKRQRSQQWSGDVSEKTTQGVPLDSKESSPKEKEESSPCEYVPKFLFP